MNNRLNERLTALPETLAQAKTAEDIKTAIVDVERLVLKSNFEDQQSGASAAFTSRDYVVGERNTRGLDWKLRLLRVIAENTFCRMVRMGVHGGQTRILGTPENIDITIRIYEAAVPAFEAASKTAFTDFSDGQSKTEGAPTVHRAGWINKHLIDQAPGVGTALQESRGKDAGSNAKLSTMMDQRGAALQEFANSLAPAKPVKEAKAPKEPKAPKTAKTAKSSGNPEGETAPAETASGNVAAENTPVETTTESAATAD